MYRSILLLSALFSAAIASPAPLEIRATPSPTPTKACNADNLERCFVRSTGLAEAFCTSYLALPSVSPVTASVTGPACLTFGGNQPTSYSASRVTSACSCIGVTPTPIPTPEACKAPKLSSFFVVNLVDGPFNGPSSDQTTVDHTIQPDAASCCARCYALGCYIYIYAFRGVSQDCYISVLIKDKNQYGNIITRPGTESKTCPLGVLSIFGVFENQSGFGLGVCGILGNGT